VTVRDRVNAAARRLVAAGLARDEAARSASLLARFVLGWSGADWVTQSRDEASADFPERFDPLVERRARHEPVAYIIGEREFYGRPFRVTPDVLIPRPETELIIDLALSMPAAPSRLIDVGTGSGCLAITLALEFPSAHVVATDISAQALAVARANAARLGVEDRIEFRHGAVLARMDMDIDAEPRLFDLLVANPPYIDPADRPSLPSDVAGHEPDVALFAEEQGLAVIRALIDAAPAALAPGGWMLVEIGRGQAEAVEKMVALTPGLTFIDVPQDLQRIPRVLVARSDR